MKLPGRAWLQFEALPRDNGQTLLTQTAFLASKGLSGLAYWYGLYPFHGMIFGNMIRAIGERCRRSRRGSRRTALIARRRWKASGGRRLTPH